MANDAKSQKRLERRFSTARKIMHNPEKMEQLLDSGFIDTFRTLHPDEVKYSWWSYRFSARAKGIGWRIDYFVVSKRLQYKIKVADIRDTVLGSDHAPVVLEIDL